MKAAFAIPLLVAAMAGAETRRLAIVVGNNAGTAELPPLRYAETDAGKFARVMAELGDVQPDDLLLLQGRSPQDLDRAFQVARERLQQWAKQPALRTVLIFYYSGHSDGESVLVGHELVSYAKLRALLEGTGADVRVGVIDACKSGGGLRARGGKPAEGFALRVADRLAAKGDVFISSSSEAELAHESNEVMGGFFTHHFVSGLRGAADVNGDKQISLSEAYRYAYDHTLAATELIGGEGQHATFDYRLSGRGELVLTDLSDPPALIEVPEGAQRVLVTDLTRDQLVAEVSSDGPRELAVAPGRYAITVVKDGQTRGTRFTVAPSAVWRPSFAELPVVVKPVQKLAAERR